MFSSPDSFPSPSFLSSVVYISNFLKVLCNSDGKGRDGNHQWNWTSFGFQGPSVKYVPSHCPPYQPSLKHLFSLMHTEKNPPLIRWLVCWDCFFLWSFIMVSVVPLVSCVLICTLKIFVYFRHKYKTSVLLVCNLGLQWFKCVCSYRLRLEGNLSKPNFAFIYMAKNLRNFIAFPRCEGCSRAGGTLLLSNKRIGYSQPCFLDTSVDVHICYLPRDSWQICNELLRSLPLSIQLYTGLSSIIL